MWPRDRTVEHLLPRSRGGRTTDDNLVVACRRCNRARRSRPVVAYVRERVGHGLEPRTDVLQRALDRLRESEHRAHREYGATQRRLLDRI